MNGIVFGLLLIAYLKLEYVYVIAEATQMTMLDVAYSLHLLMVFIFIRLFLAFVPKENRKPPEHIVA